METFDRVVPDTNILIEGVLSEKIQKEWKVDTIIIHHAVLAELEHQANMGKTIGFVGLDELKKLRDLANKNILKIEYKGKRPSSQEIKYAGSGEIDAIIRELAYDEDALLLTADKVQFHTAEARGVKVRLIKQKDVLVKKLKLEEFFDETTMSVHLKEDVFPYAKRGFPGSWQFIQLSDKKLTQEVVQDIARELVEETKKRRDSYIELERAGSTIIQLANFRIVITRPPLSDGWEVTAVRPVKKLSLDEYHLSEKLMDRLEKQAEGILVAGAPGMGKCLPGETKLYTKDFQPISIKEIYENHTINEVLGINNEGKVEKVKIKRRTKRQEGGLIYLKTKCGRELTLTKNHPLLVYNNGKIEWIDAEHVQSGEKIAVLKGFIPEQTSDDLDMLEYFPKKKTLCKVAHSDLEIPIRYKVIGGERSVIDAVNKGMSSSQEIAKLNGLNKRHVQWLIRNLVHKGILEKSKRNETHLKQEKFSLAEHPFLVLEDVETLGLKDSIVIDEIGVFLNSLKRITMTALPKSITPELCRLLGYYYAEGGGTKFSFTNECQVLQEDFKQCLGNIFGITETKKWGLTTYTDIFSSLEPMMSAWGCSLQLKQKSRHMQLPEFLYKCSEQNLTNFLGSYFDGDGHIDRDQRLIEYYTSSEIAAKQLCRLLARIGIFAKLKRKYSKGWWRYNVKIDQKDSLTKFYEKIPLKMKKREDIQEIVRNKKYTQQNAYDGTKILKNLTPLKFVKKKSNLSFERGQGLTAEYYKTFFEYVRNADTAIVELKEIIRRVYECVYYVEKNETRLTPAFLTQNHMDHYVLHAWEKGRERGLSTLNKLNYILGNDKVIEAKTLSLCLERTIKICKVRREEIAQMTGIDLQTFNFRIAHGWNFETESLTKIAVVIDNLYFRTRKNFENQIKTLGTLFESDIFFDKIVKTENRVQDEEVYDIETTTHNFIAGDVPLVVHNSTMASALAIFYADKGKIVKTIEAPRDLVLPENVTQYAISHGDAQEIHDILLLTRPDYTIFDEMRNTKDFLLFADLRLAGIGLAGVIHATNPIDAIQRFVGRIELGVIPHVVDTVIFIKNGQIAKVLSLEMTVKVPSGMTEADLARPVVTVYDFETKRLEYEIYSYGEETVVVPVTEERQYDPTKLLAAKQIEQEMRNYVDKVKVKVSGNNKAEIFIPEEDIARIIGKQGKNIEKIEKDLGFSIDVKALDDFKQPLGNESGKKQITYKMEESKNALVIRADEHHAGEAVEIYVDGHFLFTSTLSKKGEIKLHKKSKLGQTLADDLHRHGKIEVRV